MPSGLGNIDLVEILFTLFWGFFIVLVLYLHREGKREGYPLVTDRKFPVEGFPKMPKPKTYYMDDGRKIKAPKEEPKETHYRAQPADKFPGAPLEPVGNPMTAAFGTGAWCERTEIIEKTLDGKPRIIPMRADKTLEVDSRDPDPRGMRVIAGDGVDVGEIVDLWIDLAEPQIYYAEAELTAGGRAMIPFGFTEIDRRNNALRVNVIYSKHFADVPQLANPDQITPREEDQISGYFGAGLLYRHEKAAEPIV